MSRLTPLTEEGLDDAQRAVYEAIQTGPRGNLGLVGPFGVYVRAPRVGDAAQALGAAVRYATDLPEHVKEVAICTVGCFFKSKFEVAAHISLARKAGVADAVLEALRLGNAPVFEDEGERLAHGVARELLNAHRISDDTYASAVEYFGEAQMVELVMTIGYYCTVSFTLNAFEVPLSEGMADPFGQGT